MRWSIVHIWSPDRGVLGLGAVTLSLVSFIEVWIILKILDHNLIRILTSIFIYDHYLDYSNDSLDLLSSRNMLYLIGIWPRIY